MKNKSKGGILATLYGYILVTYRKVFDITQAEFSARLNIARRVIVDFERGNRTIFDHMFLTFLKRSFRTPEEFAEFLLLCVKDKSWEQLQSEIVQLMIGFLSHLQKIKKDNS